MPKTIYTPREELVCGKLDVLEDMARKLQSVEILDLLRDVRHDCERMEAKLVSRKDEVERLRKVLHAQSAGMGSFAVTETGDVVRKG